MLCPRDGTEMRTARRAGVEIDWCPACGGVWLDRGEIERICDRAALPPGFAEPPAVPPRPPGDRTPEDRDEPAKASSQDSDRPDGDRLPKRRRRTFLDDIFDL